MLSGFLLASSVHPARLPDAPVSTHGEKAIIGARVHDGRPWSWQHLCQRRGKALQLLAGQKQGHVPLLVSNLQPRGGSTRPRCSPQVLEGPLGADLCMRILHPRL